MWKRLIGYSLLFFVLAASAGFAWLWFRQPSGRPAQNVRVSMTPENIERGRYVYLLASCDGCHTPSDMTRAYMPPLEAKRGSGQPFDFEGLPGRIVVSNITPDPETGIGTWTDGEKLRAIREGISRDGRALFGMMPYSEYRHMSDEDAHALVAYLNTLTPLNNPLPKTELNFPVNLLNKFAPKPVEGQVKSPPSSNTLAYGEYLVTLGSCAECHTPMVQGSPVAAKRLAGGNEFKLGKNVVYSANITPDKATGIGDWGLDRFLDRFHQHRVPVALLPPLTPETFTVMPWTSLSRLTDEDLTAIYQYLRAQRPIENRVVTHPK